MWIANASAVEPSHGREHPSRRSGRQTSANATRATAPAASTAAASTTATAAAGLRRARNPAAEKPIRRTAKK